MAEDAKSPSDCSKLDYDGFAFENVFDCCQGVADIEGQGPALVKADQFCFSTADLCASADNVERCCIDKVQKGKWDLACFALYAGKEDLLNELKADVSATIAVEFDTPTPILTTGGAASVVSAAIATVAMFVILA
jgi:hypothetical protein